eukprot:jgi/Psemu1/56536/gm1.56536_g
MHQLKVDEERLVGPVSTLNGLSLLVSLGWTVSLGVPPTLPDDDPGMAEYTKTSSPASPSMSSKYPKALFLLGAVLRQGPRVLPKAMHQSEAGQALGAGYEDPQRAHSLSLKEARVK